MLLLLLFLSCQVVIVRRKGGERGKRMSWAIEDSSVLSIEQLLVTSDRTTAQSFREVSEKNFQHKHSDQFFTILGACCRSVQGLPILWYWCRRARKNSRHINDAIALHVVSPHYLAEVTISTRIGIIGIKKIRGFYYTTFSTESPVKSCCPRPKPIRTILWSE